MSALVLGLTQRDVKLVDEVLQSGFDEVFYLHVTDKTSAGHLLDIVPDILVVTKDEARDGGMREVLSVAASLMIPVSIR